jgi:cytochrome c biogenesis protein
MALTSQGIELQSGSRGWRASVELLSCMRFSISLLTVICIASVIGTVLKQHEPIGNYVNQFGPFWAEFFAMASLNSVYSAWWFLLILAFLVASTSLCVARNTPKILADLNSYKEGLREQSLQAFGQRASAEVAEPAEIAARRLGKLLVSGGWKVKLQERNTAEGKGWMVAAKAGVANKIGYIAAHSAIVLVCLGGLLDGDLILRAQMLFNGKTPFNASSMIASVPEQHRLSERNPTFRANLLVAEGAKSDTAVVNQSEGVLLQELPFSVELKKFIVEYYSTGMPKLFASEIVIHDKSTGEKIPTRVEVNHPASYRGIEIYQSGFDDGGSAVKFDALPMHAQAPVFSLQGTIGISTPVVGGRNSAAQLTVEFTGLRVINVENFAPDSLSGVDARKVDLRASLDASLGAANKTKIDKELRNVGPSVSYKLRDSAGQAREFNNYMLPVDMGDGTSAFLLGTRDTPAEPFRYLRVPADEKGSLDDFLRLRYALLDSNLRSEAVRRYVTKSVDSKNLVLLQQLSGSALSAFNLFAGDAGQSGAKPVSGLQAVADFIEDTVTVPERNRAGEVLIRLLNGSIFELLQLTRERAGLAPLIADEKSQAFMTQAVLALSDAPLYPAPFVLQLTDFTQVQASVFQVARAPGKAIVYLGCALLILGVFAMLYVRERRLWIWLSPCKSASDKDRHHSMATMAMSANRKTMDSDREFEQLKSRLLGIK